MVSEPMVMAGGDVVGRANIASLCPVAARLTRVPLNVITPPGVSVWDPIIYCDWLFAVMVSEPMVIRGGDIIVGASTGVGVRTDVRGP